MRALKYSLLLLLFLLVVGLFLPQKMVIPVSDATSADWNHNTFWYEPWGSSIVHKGIDIFGDKGQSVIAAERGIVLYVGTLSKGGNIIVVLGPKWRIHYYSHLQQTDVSAWQWVAKKQKIATLGDSGNARGKAPHLHFSVVSLIPIPWEITTQTHGWKRMFYLNPHELLQD